MTWFSVLFLFFFTCLAATASKNDPFAPQQAEISWEPVDDATGYDLLLNPHGSSSEKDGKRFDRLRKSEVSVKLPPGRYTMRLRSRDHRSVPGEWSAPVDLFVPFGELPLKIQSITEDKSNDQILVKLEWQKLKLAEDYQVTAVDNSNEKQVFKEQTSKNQITVPLNRGGPHGFTLQALLDGEPISKLSTLTSDIPKLILDSPDIKQEESDSSLVLKWKSDARAMTDTIESSCTDGLSELAPELQRIDFSTKTWSIDKGPFKMECLIKLNSNADGFRPSQVKTVKVTVAPRTKLLGWKEREVYPGPRWNQLILEYTAYPPFETNILKDVTGVQGNVILTNKTSFFGTATMGYRFRRGQHIGTALIGIGGQENFGANYTYGEFELNYTYRVHPFFDLLIGYAMDDNLVQAQRNTLSGVDEDNLKLSLASYGGLRLGLASEIAITRRFGIRAEASRLSLLHSLKSPSGEPIQSAEKMRVGIFGSLQMSERRRGYIGFIQHKVFLAYPTANNKDINNELFGESIILQLRMIETF